VAINGTACHSGRMIPGTERDCRSTRRLCLRRNGCWTRTGLITVQAWILLSVVVSAWTPSYPTTCLSNGRACACVCRLRSTRRGDRPEEACGVTVRHQARKRGIASRAAFCTSHEHVPIDEASVHAPHRAALGGQGRQAREEGGRFVDTR
jgi:hypothetical protein